MDSCEFSTNVLLCRFKSYTNRTIDLIHRVHQGQLDSSATNRAFKLIEENAKLQSLILNQLNQLLDLRGTPDKFDAEVSILDFKCYLYTIRYSLHLLGGGRLDRNTTIEKLKLIEHKSKLQISLIEKLLN